MQNAFDLLDEENKIILIEKMDGWTKQKSYPILKLTRNCTAKYTRISLENSDSIVGELWVPVTYTVQDNPNFNKTSFRDVIWLKFTEKKLLSENYLYFDPSKFSKEGWIIINLQQAGKHSSINYLELFYVYLNFCTKVSYANSFHRILNNDKCVTL